LIEQFLRDSTNQRTDVYGGSRENRVRLLQEVAEAVAKECGGDRVGVRLSPVTPANDIGPDSDPMATYGHTVEQLNAFGLAYIHVIEGATQGPRDIVDFDFQALRRAFKGFYIANNGYDLTLALAARQSNHADLIAFGRLYIANPDLVERLRIGARLNEPNRETFFGGAQKGYTDYPFLTPAERALSGMVV
jgi:N-ethylmaleimide reductase